MSSDEATANVVRAFAALEIPYLLAGSFSSNYYGVARSTQDADFVVQIDGAEIDAIAAELGERYVMDPQLSFETVTGTYRFVAKVSGTPFKIEFFRLSEDPHDQARFARRVSVKMLNTTVCLPTAEDVIVRKLRWARSKDLDDVRDVIAVQGDALDWDYIHGWTAKHGSQERLDRIRTLLASLGV